MPEMQVEYRSEPPSAEQFAALFETTGWNRLYQAAPEELAAALANSQLCISAYDGARLVGFGRVVSDGVIHALIFDMIVDPEYQRGGIGTEVLRRLLAWCQDRRIRDIQLFCARGKRGFYEKNGFTARPEDAPGMQFSRR